MQFKDLEWKDTSAKNVAYKTYSNEMARIKKAVDYLVAEDSY